jgi:protein-S-isoprenylcysteine O-methyltransferase Ste14
VAKHTAPKPALSLFLVIAQFSLLVVLVLYAGLWGTWWQNVLLLAGVALGVWAVATMRYNVSILPDVRRNQQLYTGGPYAYIRHPMYSALLLIGLALVLHNISLIPVVLWLLLLVTLLTKLHYEERLLQSHFTNYKQYQKRTKKIIPFVY